MYEPDSWVVIKINGKNPHYRVLAGWSGSYLQGGNWRINSGITKVEEDDSAYYFSGSSGSTYRCGKQSYGLRINNAYVWNDLVALYGDMVQMMPEDTDWNNVNWSI